MNGGISREIYAIFVKNKLMKHLLLSILFLATIGNSIAQTKGQVTYALDFSSDNPEMAMMLSMMQGSTMEMYFMPKKSRIEMSMGTFIKMNTVMDAKADKGLLLMEMMGNKTATETKISEMKEGEKAPEIKVEVTTETKEIIGFKCIKTILRDSEGKETIMWIVTDLKADLKGHQQFGNAPISGVPLEFSTTVNGMTIHFVASKFEGSVDKKIFSTKVPEGYKIVSAEELKMMGGGQ
jgi:GLPGLI family protein